MEKVEKFIVENTRNCSNEIIIPTQDGYSYTKGYTSWLTIGDARKVADIARQETIKEVCEWIKNNAGRYSWYDPIEDNEGFNVSGLIDDLKKYLEGKA